MFTLKNKNPFVIAALVWVAALLSLVLFSVFTANPSYSAVSQPFQVGDNFYCQTLEGKEDYEKVKEYFFTKSLGGTDILEVEEDEATNTTMFIGQKVVEHSGNKSLLTIKYGLTYTTLCWSLISEEAINQES